jgi:hypothetical protein
MEKKISLVEPGACSTQSGTDAVDDLTGRGERLTQEQARSGLVKDGDIGECSANVGCNSKTCRFNGSGCHGVFQSNAITKIML